MMEVGWTRKTSTNDSNFILAVDIVEANDNGVRLAI